MKKPTIRSGHLALPLLAALMALLLAACAGAAGPALAPPPASAAGAGSLTPAPVSATAPAANAAAPEADASAARILRGDDQVIARPRSAAPVSGPRAALNFQNASLADVAHVVLREMARVDYIVHPPINGTVTLSTREPVSTDQALYLLEAALQANGFAMVRDTHGVYHIGKPEVLRGIVAGVRLAAGGSTELPPGTGAIVVQLKYIGAAEMAAILRPLAPPEAIARVDTVRNLLVLIGSRTQAEGWLDLVNTFDVNLLKGMSVGVFPLRYASAKDIEAAFRLIAASTASAAAAPAAAASGPGIALGGSPLAPPGRLGMGPGVPSAPAFGSGASPAASSSDPAAVAALAAQFPLNGAVRILPIERLNSVLVVTPRAAYLDEVRSWIEKLDRPGFNSGDAQLFVYAVQNGSAGHLADVLNGLFGATGGTSSSSDNGVAPGLRSASASSGAARAPAMGAAGAGGGAVNALDPNAGTRAGSSNVTAVALASGVRIVADDLNNAVLVYGSKADYDKIEATLKRLDIPPTQVMIEASIIEVTLTNDLQYGLEWLFTDRHGGHTGTGALSNETGGGFAGPGTGFSYTVLNSAGQVRAVLNALASKSLVKVISSPSLMVLDNHTASINVGNQQPVQTSTTITDGGNTTTSIQYKDTGVSLSVTPSVNSGNMVTMQLSQAMTDVGPVDTAATGQRSFLQRQISSKVAVRSGETLVLGGLIQDNTTTGNSGVPLLKDIPLLGALFGTQSDNTNRTELIVVITPRVVRGDEDMRAVSADLRDRMKTLQSLPESPKITQPAGNTNDE